MLRARCYSKDLTCINEFGPQNNPMRNVLLLSHFTDEETDA